jgi:hypothetical protein
LARERERLCLYAQGNRVHVMVDDDSLLTFCSWNQLVGPKS